MAIEKIVAEIKEKHKGHSELDELVGLCEDGLFEMAGQLLCEIFDDKALGKQLFKLAVDSQDVWDLPTLACSIADDAFLGDKEWAKEVLADALERSEEFAQVLNIAKEIADEYSVNDKVWGKQVFDLAAEKAETSTDYSELGNSTVDDRYLGDKDSARALFKSAVDTAVTEIDFRLAALGIGGDGIGLGDKSWAIDVCKMALEKMDDPDDIKSISEVMSEFS